MIDERPWRVVLESTAGRRRNSLVALAAAAFAAFVLSSLFYSPLLAGNL
jgi:hypothetical protein